jgi:hypothetical protein
MAPNTIPMNKITNFGGMNNWELEDRDFLPDEDNAMLPLFTVCTVDTGFATTFRCFIISTAL